MSKRKKEELSQPSTANVLNNQLQPKLVSWFDNHFYKVEERFDVSDTLGRQRRDKLFNKLTDSNIQFIQKENDAWDIYLPSVTTYLQAYPKPFLERWRGDIGNLEADRRMNEAAERGTRVHYAIWVLLNGGTVVYNPWSHPHYTPEQIANMRSGAPHFAVLERQEEMYQVDKVKRWLDTLQPEIVGTELMVCSMDLLAAGTVDLLCRIKPGTYHVNGSKPISLKGGLYVADWKTSNQLSGSYDLQVAAYGKMITEDPKITEEIAGGLIVHTNATKIKSGIHGLATRYLDKDEMESSYYTFKNVQEVYMKTAGLDKPLVFEFPSMLTWNGAPVAAPKEQETDEILLLTEEAAQSESQN